MKNNYWMKLWFDILRDPKMGMLPDRLWRRVIELFLIAGQEGEDGLLPDVATIAWQLNKPVTAINTDLVKIAEVGIVSEYEAGKWLVTNFKKRNEPVDPMKRMKDFRTRERYIKGDESETEMKRECDAAVTTRNQEEQKNRRTETELKDSPPPPEARDELVGSIFKSYEHEIGMITQTVADDIKSAAEDYPLEWFGEAFKEAARNNKRNWRYALAILKRWKVDGYKVDTRQKQPARGNNGTKPTKYDATVQAGTYEAWSKRGAR